MIELTQKQAFWLVVYAEAGLEYYGRRDSVAYQKAKEASEIVWEAYCEGELPT